MEAIPLGITVVSYGGTMMRSILRVDLAMDTDDGDERNGPDQPPLTVEHDGPWRTE